MFEAHGRYHIHIDNDILHIEAFGPWNFEAAQLFDREVRALVEARLTRPWAMLGIIHGEGIYTPESIPLLRILHQWRVAHGMSHVAIVNSTEHNAAAPLTKAQFNQIYSDQPDTPCLERYFDSLQQALAWLREAGFHPAATS